MLPKEMKTWKSRLQCLPRPNLSWFVLVFSLVLPFSWAGSSHPHGLSHAVIRPVPRVQALQECEPFAKWHLCKQPHLLSLAEFWFLHCGQAVTTEEAFQANILHKGRLTGTIPAIMLYSWVYLYSKAGHSQNLEGHASRIRKTPAEPTTYDGLGSDFVSHP